MRMDGEMLGWGVALAWLGLPLLSLPLRKTRWTDARSRQRALLWTLALSLALFGVPSLRQAAPLAARVSVPASALAVLPTGAVRLEHAVSASRGPSWLVLGWLSLTALGGLRLLWQAWRISRRCRQGEAASGEVLESVRRICGELGIRPPRTRVAELERVPFVAGLGRGTLVLPRWMLEELGQMDLDLVLRHEVLHLAQGDLFNLALAALLRLPFTGHPTARWLMQELTLVREERVDRRVVETGSGRYARLLVTVAEQTQGEYALTAGMGSGNLARRIDRLLHPFQGERVSLLPSLALALLLAGVTVLMPHLAGATEPTDVSGEEAPVLLAVPTHQSKLLKLPNVRTISIADPAIAEIKVIDGELLVTGVATGKTTMIVWFVDRRRVVYTVSVEG